MAARSAAITAAGLARRLGEAERILLGCYLGADELARQLAERDTGGFEVVHGIHGEHTAAVKVALDRFVGERYIALDVAVVAGIVAQTLHGQHRDDQLVGIRALAYQIGIAVQIGGQRGQLIGFVEQRKDQLAAAEYGFAVKEATAALKFSSESARKAFVADLTAKKLPVQEGKLLGLEDFTKTYQETDPNAFLPENDDTPSMSISL